MFITYKMVEGFISITITQEVYVLNLIIFLFVIYLIFIRYLFAFRKLNLENSPVSPPFLIACSYRIIDILIR